MARSVSVAAQPLIRPEKFLDGKSRDHPRGRKGAPKEEAISAHSRACVCRRFAHHVKRGASNSDYPDHNCRRVKAIGAKPPAFDVLLHLELGHHDLRRLRANGRSSCTFWSSFSLATRHVRCQKWCRTRHPLWLFHQTIPHPRGRQKEAILSTLRMQLPTDLITPNSLHEALKFRR